MSSTNEFWLGPVQRKITEVLAEYSSLPSYVSSYTGGSVASFIDHTLLKPEATAAQIVKLSNEALQYDFKACCVNGSHIRRVAIRLYGSQCVPCAVVGFPLGAGKSSVKAEAREAVQDGAREIDMVINIGALKAGDYALVYDDIRQVVESVNIPVKVILETGLLSDEEKIAGSYLSAEAGAQFVKTCTGFMGGEATVADVVLMKRTVQYKPGVKVKASAGIRTADKCVELLRAGADRIGTSSGVAIIKGMDANTAL